MSRLSTKLSAWLAPRVQIGIAIQRDRVNAVAIARGAQPRVIGAATQSLTQPWFNGKPQPANIAELGAALKALVSQFDAAASIALSLPDPTGSYAIFEFEVLPKTREALNDLVRWRFAKELHHDEATIVCQSQRLGAVKTQQAVFAVALDRAWLTAALDAAAVAGLVVAKLDTGIGYRFNRFYSSLVAATPKDGGIFAIARDFWSVTLWDARGHIRFARARWRHDGDLDAIFTEAARLIRASRGLAAVQSLVLYIACAQTDDLAAAVSAMQARTGEECRPLNAEQGFSIAANVVSPDDASAIDAALNDEA